MPIDSSGRMACMKVWVNYMSLSCSGSLLKLSIVTGTIFRIAHSKVVYIVLIIKRDHQKPSDMFLMVKREHIAIYVLFLGNVPVIRFQKYH
jgi:hypothetical protein